MSDKNKAGEVSIRVSRVSTYINHNIKSALPEVYELACYKRCIKDHFKCNNLSCLFFFLCTIWFVFLSILFLGFIIYFFDICYN